MFGHLILNGLEHRKTPSHKAGFCLDLSENNLAFVKGLNSQAKVLNTCSRQVDCT